MTHPTLASRHVTPMHCSHLRHKGMYIVTDVTPDPNGFVDHIEATSFWCVCTQKAFGPDGLPVTLEDCAAGRGCCDHDSAQATE